MNTPRRNFHKQLAALGLGFVGGRAFAQGAWPNRPLKMLVPFPSGGTADVLCRLLAQRLQDVFGQSVVVDNKPGAAGNIGSEIVPSCRTGIG